MEITNLANDPECSETVGRCSAMLEGLISEEIGQDEKTWVVPSGRSCWGGQSGDRTRRDRFMRHASTVTAIGPVSATARPLRRSSMNKEMVGTNDTMATPRTHQNVVANAAACADVDDPAPAS